VNRGGGRVRETLGEPREARTLARGGVYVHAIDAAAVRSARARALEERLPLGGLVLAVKDNIAVEGQPLGAGSATRVDMSPEPRDAPVLARLRGAGATFAGTVTMHELACGVTGVNGFAGTPENPLAPGCIPGGSSSGSAIAVAEGSAHLALGTDTGGSCRIPAAFCGVVGFKPAFGSYPRERVLPLAPSLDCVGLLARHARLVAPAHRVLGGAEILAVLPQRIGYSAEQAELADPLIGARLEELLHALSTRGSEVREVPWPHGEDVFEAGTAIFLAEAAATFGHLLSDPANLLGEDLRTRLQAGLEIPAVEYIHALEQKSDLRRRALAVLSDVECVLGPTVPIVPPELTDDVVKRTPEIVANTRLANVTGLPAISIPVPRRPPSGVQLTAADDERTLAFGMAIEAALGPQQD
jgi:Asp-tRNA(Asn)/Glu-tRNA(Gln) amidotransferase A subunit family amidase